MTTVCFDRVSKEFTLHLQRSRSLQELFVNLRNLRQKPTREQYWALRDVSFEINPGEMVGIIGPNGAGKSTILKLISRIIEPTSGTVQVNGNVGALLELGAGFHPDLTGRENVYLNGSIIGLSKADVSRIFDDIVDFSEMGRFIDVPVKHYSSGMYMRLGFAIAINLQPEILLVDEVLAVGDQAFQSRCLDKINELRRQGISIVLVTHSLESVREMCDRAIWLDKGRIQAEGPVVPVLDHYMTHVMIGEEQDLLTAKVAGPKAEADESDSLRRWGSREAEIVRVELLDTQGQERRIFQTGDAFTIRIHFVAKQRIENPKFGIAIYHASGFQINGPNTASAGLEIDAIEGTGYMDHVVERLPLLEGTYLLSVSVDTLDGARAYDFHHQTYTFRVRPRQTTREEYGCVSVPASWQPGPTGIEYRFKSKEAGP